MHLPWIAAILWTAGIAVAVGGLVLYVGLYVANPLSGIVARDHEDFLEQRQERRRSVWRTVEASGSWAAWIYGMILFALTFGQVQFDPDTGEPLVNVTEAWGLAYLFLLVLGLVIGKMFRDRIEAYWDRRIMTAHGDGYVLTAHDGSRRYVSSGSAT